MTSPLGFADLDPDTWITTAEIAARMGYTSIRRWYADASRRRAAEFPLPRRRGFYRVGDILDWDRAGGLTIAIARQTADQSSLSAANDDGRADTPEIDHDAPRALTARRLRILAERR